MTSNQNPSDTNTTAIADWILKEFDSYYSDFRHIPELAKKAFEDQDAQTSLALSKKRLSAYSGSVARFAVALSKENPLLGTRGELWDEIEIGFLALISKRYEADLAYAYMHSVRRAIYQGVWKAVEYSFGEAQKAQETSFASLCRTFPVAGQLNADTVIDILSIPGFSRSYWNIEGDAQLLCDRTKHMLQTEYPEHTVTSIEMIDAGFYRNRGAYLVGRINLHPTCIVPFVIALENGDHRIYVDALLCQEADIHNIFSSTLANFHVTTAWYHELSNFLHSIMPKRPLGLHYSTIGFNHFGKVAVMHELRDELAQTGEVLDTAPGFKGTVAIGFSSPSSDYNLKIIRDHPTEDYKWGEFEGIDSVLEKYDRVHEINRTGSMLDNVIYYNLKLNNNWFNPELLDELLSECSNTVVRENNAVIFRYLIVQRRLTPLPVFLETASEEDAEAVIVNLGYCIKNNAAANIFNKDLDARNYGVSRFLKVYLFDYDALEPFNEVKIRTNTDMEDGEDDIPDWYFEDGVIFLPEEIEAGLRIPNRQLRRLFRDVHGDLLTMKYWEGIQNALKAGRVPKLRVYPESRKLLR